MEHKGRHITFPLGNEKLMLGDYLADDGIHHVNGLEEEVVVPYTAEQQAVYNQIKNTIKSYSGNTNIYSTNEVSPVFDVVAYADLNSVIESLDNRITLLE